MKSEEAISKIVASHGATLYDTEIASEFDETIFRVSIVKEGGVLLDLCSPSPMIFRSILMLILPWRGNIDWK